jgi:sugar phosphate isomerase/epimerase
VHNIFSEKKIERENVRGDLLSSTSRGDRRDAVKKTIATIETARRLGCDTIVLHLGGVDLPRAKRQHSRLCEYIANFGRTREHADELRRMVKKRAAEAPPFFEAVVESLKEIFEECPDARLGVENRYFWHEIPTPDELEQLFNMFPKQGLFYWHDAGHGQVQEYMGWRRHAEWLEKFKGRMIGAHLHDMIRARDHVPPGKGTMDLKWVVSQLPENVLTVMEVAAGYPVDDVAQGKHYLERIIAECANSRKSQ